MNRLFGIPDDFEATIRIFTTEQGGRKSPPFNGIRWDFGYADDPQGSQICMIPPDFFDANGDSLPLDQPLPVDVELTARMSIVVDETRVAYHRNRIKIGTRFYCQEGYRRYAEGVITRITGLFEDR